MWIEKYKPRTFDGIIGNAAVIKYIKEYKWKRPLLIYGSTGVGKTVLAEAIANEFNFELVEITNRKGLKDQTISTEEELNKRISLQKEHYDLNLHASLQEVIWF